MKIVLLKTKKITAVVFFAALTALFASDCFAAKEPGLFSIPVSKNANQGPESFQQITKAAQPTAEYGNALFKDENSALMSSTAVPAYGTRAAAKTSSGPVSFQQRTGTQTTAPRLAPANQNAKQNNPRLPNLKAPDAEKTTTDYKVEAALFPTENNASDIWRTEQKVFIQDNDALQRAEEDRSAPRRTRQNNTQKPFAALKNPENRRCNHAKQDGMKYVRIRDMAFDASAKQESNGVFHSRTRLSKDPASFGKKNLVKNVCKNQQNTAENLYRAVSGIIPFQKNSLITQAKVLTAQDNINPLLPPLPQPIEQQPVDVPEKSETYKQSSIGSRSSDGIVLYQVYKDHINSSFNNAGFPEQLLQESINYSKTGLSPPGNAIILNPRHFLTNIPRFLCLSESSDESFEYPYRLNSTVSKKHNRIIDPPMRLREAFYLGKNVISEASLNFIYRAAASRTKRAASHPPEVQPYFFSQLNAILVNRSNILLFWVEFQKL